jgi:flagellum-specific peptidoglycan hydrolase FlgJ
MRNLMKQTQKGEKSIILRSLPNYVPITRFQTTFFKFLLIFVLLFLNVSGTNSVPEKNLLGNKDGKTKVDKKKEDPAEVYINGVKSRVYDQLLLEVKTFMNETAPDSKLDPDFVTSKCLEYDMDIVFVLAQGILESHLGTKGKAKETNSVWNVGTFDDGTIRYTYRHPNESMEPYLILLKNKYLITITAEGDTIYKDLHHLIQDKGYKNLKGKRYATARGYEEAMRSLIVQIDMKTSISFYQDLYNMPKTDILAYFAPSERMQVEYALMQSK